MDILTEGYVSFQKYVDYPKKCYAHNFVMTINAEGNVVFCKNTRDNPLFYIGSLYKETVSQIQKNSKIKKDLEKNLDYQKKINLIIIKIQKKKTNILLIKVKS